MYCYIATLTNATDESEYTKGNVETHCVGNSSLFASNTNEDYCFTARFVYNIDNEYKIALGQVILFYVCWFQIICV